MPSYVRLNVQTEHRMAVHRCESIVLIHSIWQILDSGTTTLAEFREVYSDLRVASQGEVS